MEAVEEIPEGRDLVPGESPVAADEVAEGLSIPVEVSDAAGVDRNAVTDSIPVEEDLQV